MSQAIKQVIKVEWPVNKRVNAYSSLRLGGQSSSPFTSFNLGHHVGDNPDNVNANRQQLIELLAMPTAPLWLSQQHTNTVIYAKEYQPAIIADAIISDRSAQVCTVMTADCLPLLLADKQGKEVAAIHGGWRGLATHIIEQTINKMKTKPDQLCAWLGPAIGPENFEVGSDVRDQFLALHHNFEGAFKAIGQNKYLANIYLIARQQLEKLGIHAIYGGNYCTYLNESHFFSYRRDGQTGRMASVIWID